MMRTITTQNFCCVCLNLRENTRKLSDSDPNQTKWCYKLQFCVPEIVWKEDTYICTLCTDQLDSVYSFRKQCIALDDVRQRQLDLCGNEEFDGEDETKEETCDGDLSEDAVYGCEECNESFKSEVAFKEHVKLHKFICFLCNQSYTTKKQLIRHIKDIHSKTNCKQESQTDICKLCGVTFSTKYLLKRHLRNVHASEKKFQCDECEQKFASSVYLSAHKRYHSSSRPYICSFCGKGFKTASDLYHHEKIHANKRAYKCIKCPKAFNTSSDLHKHNICVHVDRSEWKYPCDRCERRFPLKTNLDAHMKTHTGERNFACHLCDRRCINRSVLMRHIESHSNVRLFRCSVCAREYKYRKSLDLHLKKAHDLGDAKLPPQRARRHVCHVCLKSYFANNKLQKHLRTHTGERPFSCPICGKTFVDGSYVRMHVKMSHPQDVNECNILTAVS